MQLLTDDSFVRPGTLTDLSDARVLFARSYLWMRTIVGILGIALPFIFIIGETYFLKAGVHVRGSISAYYHTPMRDFFVGGLCVAGFLLITYMLGQSKRTDFKLSLVAGIALLLVVFFPTGRPHIPDGAPLCGSTPEPAGCSSIQQTLGETPVATVHFVSAAIFVLGIAGICFYFAHRETLPPLPNARMHTVQTILGYIVLGAVAWVIVGGLLDITLWELTPLYIGEVISVWGFGASWLLAGRALWRALFPLPSPPAKGTVDQTAEGG